MDKVEWLIEKRMHPLRLLVGTKGSQTPSPVARLSGSIFCWSGSHIIAGRNVGWGARRSFQAAILKRDPWKWTPTPF